MQREKNARILHKFCYSFVRERERERDKASVKRYHHGPGEFQRVVARERHNNSAYVFSIYIKVRNATMLTRTARIHFYLFFTFFRKIFFVLLFRGKPQKKLHAL